jgi:hypothetical protein
LSRIVAIPHADLGNYSAAVGSAQILPNGNLQFTSGFQGSFPNNVFGQTIEVLPDGTKTYVQQMTGVEYRSYLMSTLYGPLANILNPGFEDPAQGTGGSAYKYDPTGTAWSFSGSAGVAGNGSGFTSGNPNAPQGAQVGVLQGGGSFSQVVTGMAAGTYQLSFRAAQRANVQAARQDFRVLVDGAVVGTFTPSNTGYFGFTTSPFAVLAGAHTIAFQGLDSAGGDNTAFVDDVRLS